jgi:hypothetical protein
MGRFNWIWPALWAPYVLLCASVPLVGLGFATRVDAQQQTEFSFTLPRGYMDSSTGRLHRAGTMRAATPGILQLAHKDPRVVANPEYLSVILLSKAVTSLGTLDMINTHIIEDLFTADFDYLNELYNTINRGASLFGSGNDPYCAGNKTDEGLCGTIFLGGRGPGGDGRTRTGYTQDRASQTIASQPDLIGLLSDASSGSFNADVTQGNGNFDLVTSGDQPIWATLQGSWSEFGTTESSYFFGAVGAHTNLSPDVLLGIMFEFDRLTQTDGATSVEGDGYLVGPYFVAKLPNQPLFIEGRLMTGQTDNEVSVGGTANETFGTQRTLASIKVAGQLNYGELALTPSLTATHLRDAQDAFENSQGNTIAAQGIEVNNVAAGLNFAQPVSLSSGELMLTGGISGIWSSSEGTDFASSAAPTTDGQRARITLGASYTRPNGVVLSAGFFYDGIGLNDYESYGLDLGVEMQF